MFHNKPKRFTLSKRFFSSGVFGTLGRGWQATEWAMEGTLFVHPTIGHAQVGVGAGDDSSSVDPSKEDAFGGSGEGGLEQSATCYSAYQGAVQVADGQRCGQVNLISPSLDETPTKRMRV